MRRFLTVIAVTLTAFALSAQSRMEIDLSKKGDPVPSSLYGVFFEEITGSGDGGLYAEMVRNRGFEEGVLPSGTTLRNGYAEAVSTPRYSDDRVQNFRIPWRDDLSMTSWRVELADGSAAKSEVTDEYPLNSATPHALKLGFFKGCGEISAVNTGYWGMHFQTGAAYKLVFYLRSAETRWVRPVLAGPDGKPVASHTVDVIPDGEWHRYEVSLTPDRTVSGGMLKLTFPTDGLVWLDYVSLFPEDTFMGRPNGLRKDVATLIADLHPSFVRWPGGCIVEGLTLENRVKWKETIGDPVQRPGEYNLWGYRSTYGFGYHEFLQFCEDIGADGMFVCNAGMSCLFRNGDYVMGDDLEPLIQEALDAVEYALGDAKTTKWGAERAKNGHPEPFPLKYVEIGNENVFSRYAENYNRFHKALKEKWPRVELVSALMFSDNIKELDKVEIIDPHYYETPEWFFRGSDVFDRLPSNLPYKVYIGEYAAGGADLYSSLSEAAFLTGVERNSGKVEMVSYAPLIENEHFGRNHLIVTGEDFAYGRTNYEILRMFSNNKPDYNVKAVIKGERLKTPYTPEGLVGLSTSGAVSRFKDFKIKAGGKTIYETDFSDFDSAWMTTRGEWSVEDGTLCQKGMGGGLAVLRDFDLKNCTITLKAKRVQGVEGFGVVFGYKDDGHYFQAETGSHTNESVIFREVGDNGSFSLFDYRNQTFLRDGHWYDVRVEIKGDVWKCYLDGSLAYEYKYGKILRHYAVAGYDKASGELIIKLVNAEAEPWNTQLALKGGKVTGQGKRISLSGPRNGENTPSSPDAITPVVESFEGSELSVKPYSFTIFRIPAKL